VVPDLYSRAWYHAGNADFLATPADAVLGQLVRNSDFSVDETQRDAWVAEIDLLKQCLDGIDGTVLLEFSIPRMGKRADAVLLIGPIVFVIEFKVGGASFDRSSVEQVWDYGLDLKNFHAASHQAPIARFWLPRRPSHNFDWIWRRTTTICIGLHGSMRKRSPSS
jgi:hypothetical protein